MPNAQGVSVKPYYADGSCVIYNADCRDILPSISGELVVTSPPYNLMRKWSGDGANSIHAGKLATKLADEWYEDEMPEDVSVAGVALLVELAQVRAHGHDRGL